MPLECSQLYRLVIKVYKKTRFLRRPFLIKIYFKFLLPTSGVLPPIFGMISLWEEPQDFNHYSFYRYFIANSLIICIVVRRHRSGYRCRFLLKEN